MQPAPSPASAHALQASPRASVDGDDHGHGDEVAKDNKASDNSDERSDNAQPPAAAADTQGSKTEAADPGSSRPGGQMSAVGKSDAPSADTTTTATPADAAGQAVVAPPSADTTATSSAAPTVAEAEVAAAASVGSEAHAGVPRARARIVQHMLRKCSHHSSYRGRPDTCCSRISITHTSHRIAALASLTDLIALHHSAPACYSSVH
jgi:hypothetical protein